jgi:hypothetical protein
MYVGIWVLGGSEDMRWRTSAWFKSSIKLEKTFRA